MLLTLGGTYVYVRQVGAYLANGMPYNSSLKVYVVPCAPCTNLSDSTSNKVVLVHICKKRALLILVCAYVCARQVKAYLANGMVHSSSPKE